MNPRDVAAQHGQIYENVKHTAWFKQLMKAVRKADDIMQSPGTGENLDIVREALNEHVGPRRADQLIRNLYQDESLGITRDALENYFMKRAAPKPQTQNLIAGGYKYTVTKFPSGRYMVSRSDSKYKLGNVFHSLKDVLDHYPNLRRKLR